ncbi:hypothetical protein O3M35_004640 [Rhynocoris fuscipes]|uniref:Hexosyltransferase n=1 Tax=Rhynocoris fuscipes TaxID=488301 RepID=A0AAW1CM08_9HEMI
MMAFRAKVLHVIIFGLIGVTVIFYSSYLSGPVLLYHIDSDRIRNTSNLSYQISPSKTTINGNVSLSPTNNTINVHQIMKIPLDNNSVNQNITFDKTTQGVLTETLYQSGYNIPNVDLCPELGNKLKLMVGIMSAPSHMDARMAIRQTWGHYGQRA